MKLLSLLIVALLTAPPLAHADLVELVRIYGPPGGDEFYHVCGPGDVNGDGYDDFMISSPVRDRSNHECENGYARLYFGGDPIDTSNYITIPAVCNEEQFLFYGFGRYCTKVGDMNGDNYPDFLVGDPNYDYSFWGPWDSGAGFVYWGGPVIDTLPGLRLIGETYNSESRFYGLGDINADSYSDIVASVSWTDDTGPVNIYLGGESPDSLPDFQIWFFGHYGVVAQPVGIIGDYNGDGKDDIVVCDIGYEFGSSAGIAYMFFGSETGFNEPDLVFHEPGRWTYGMLLSGCGDLNNDGFDEFMTAAWGTRATLFIYYGSQNPDTIPDLIISREVPDFPNYLSGGGDLNQDGYADIALSNNWWSNPEIGAGQVLVYYGGEEMDTIPDIVICGVDRHQLLGAETTFPGDINGDGYPEFIASSKNAGQPGRSCVAIYTTNTTSVEPSDPLPLASEIELRCYPNPFNASTVIKFKAQAKQAKLEIFDLAGRKVRSFNVKDLFGERRIIWDGTNEIGEKVSSGIYFYRLTAGDRSQTERMLLLR